MYTKEQQITVMNGYELYSLYQSLKLHFTTDKYNYFQYDGKTKTSIDAFQKRRDKFLFHRLARKYTEDEILLFLVSNFIERDNNWTKFLLEDEAEQTYRDWKHRIDLMEKTYEEDLHKICPDKKEFNKLFEVQNGQLPKLLVFFLQKEITLETIVILNTILNFLPIWDKKIEDDIFYPKISRKVRKYAPFLKTNLTKYKLLTKKILLE
jgi:hypothetical protein